MGNNDLEGMNFEELMSELKVTLELLERGELSLEESMRSYERGVALVRTAEDKLKKMEGRMEEILADGTVNELKVDIAADSKANDS